MPLLEEIEFVNLDLTSKVELMAYIVVPLCVVLYIWAMGDDDGDDESSKKSSRRK